MGRRSFPLVVTALVVVGFAQPVMAAAESSEAAEAVEFRGYFIEDGAPVDFDDMERLVSDFEGQGFGFVALDADPVDGADLYADEVRQASSARTIIVVSAGEIGYVSDDYGTVELNAAAGAAIGTFDTSYVEGFRRFANALAGVPVAAGAAPGSITTPTVAPQAQSEPGGSAATGGGGGFVAFLLIVVAIIGFFFWMSRRNKRKQTAQHAQRIEELKSEIRAEMDAAANEILELEDRVRLSENDRAQDLYAAGAQGYAEFQEELDAATTFERIHELGNKVDKTLWQLEAAEAIIEGRDVPPEPEPEPLPLPSALPEADKPRHRDLPPELDVRRDRREPLPTGRSSRGGGFGSLGGLGSIAVILRELQRASQRSRTSTRPRVRGGGRSNSGVQVPRFPGLSGGSRGGGTARRSSRRSSTPTRSSPRGSGSKPRGRGRRRR